MGSVLTFAKATADAESDPQNDGSEKEPDTPDRPLDEPRPPRIDDPPPAPAPTPPYVVGARRSAKQEERP